MKLAKVLQGSARKWYKGYFDRIRGINFRSIDAQAASKLTYAVSLLQTSRLQSLRHGLQTIQKVYKPNKITAMDQTRIACHLLQAKLREYTT